MPPSYNFNNKKVFLILANSNKETQDLKVQIKDHIQRGGGKILLTLSHLIDFVICIYSCTLKHHEHFISMTLPTFNRAIDLDIPFISCLFYSDNFCKSLDDYRITEINVKSKSILYVKKVAAIQAQTKLQDKPQQPEKIPTINTIKVEEKLEEEDDDLTNFEGLFDNTPQEKNKVIKEVIVEEEEENEIEDDEFWEGLFGRSASDIAPVKPSQKQPQQPQQQQQQQQQQEEVVAEIDEDEYFMNNFGGYYDNSSVSSKSISLSKSQLQKAANEININNNNQISQIDEEKDIDDFYHSTKVEVEQQQQEEKKKLLDFSSEINSKLVLTKEELGCHNKNLMVSFQEKSGHIVFIRLEEFQLNLQSDTTRQMSMNKNGFVVNINSSNRLNTTGKLTKSLKFENIDSLSPSNAHNLNLNQYTSSDANKYKQVVVSLDHLLLLETTNRLYSFGVDKYGQLGTNCLSNLNYAIPNAVPFPVPGFTNPIPSAIKIQMISCNQSYSAALALDGTVYTWGLNNSGQLGCGNVKNQYTPRQIEGLRDIIYITTAEQHMCVMGRNNELYAWGTFTNQTNKSLVHSTSPIRIDTDSDVCLKKIFSIGKITVVMTNKPEHKIQYFGHDLDGEYQRVIKLIEREFKSFNDYQLLDMSGKIALKVFNPYNSLKFMIEKSQNNEFIKHLKSNLKDITQEMFLNLTLLAIKYNNLEAFKLIFSHYQYPFILHESSMYTHTLIPEYLLSKRENVLKYIDSLDENGLSALHLSANNNNNDFSKILLKYGCDRNLQDSNGGTAMHVAVKLGYVQHAILLANNGAQSIPDKNMKTPVQYLSDATSKQSLQSAIFTNEIFLSYAHKDSVFVNGLRLKLESLSLRCWLDEYRLEAGCDWRAEIIKGIENCQYVFFVISDVSVHSLWCRKELKISKRLGKLIIPVLYKDVPIDPVLMGLFDVAPLVIDFQPDLSWNEQEKFHREIKSIANSIKSNSIKRLHQNNNRLLEEFKRSKMFYLTFSNSDRLLTDLVKESLISRGIPTLNRDDIYGRPSAKDDEFSKQNLKLKRKKEKLLKLEKELAEKAQAEIKEKSRKLKWKTQMKLDKRLEKDPDFIYTKEYQEFKNIINGDAPSGSKDSNHGSSYFDHQISFSSIDYFTSSNQDIYQNQEPVDLSFDSNNYEKRADDFYFDQDKKEEIIESNEISECIQECLGQLLIVTDKSDFEFLEKELLIGKNLKKTIMIITPKFEFKLKAPTSFHSFPWYEIKYQKEEILLDNLVYNYEILEKTFNVSKQHKALLLLKEQEEIQAQIENQKLIDEAKKLKKQQLLYNN